MIKCFEFNIMVTKQWRSWLDATFRGLWSGFALFALQAVSLKILYYTEMKWLIIKQKIIGRRRRTSSLSKQMVCLFVWFDSLRPINNLSVIKGRVFLGWTSTKLGLVFLLKDTTQWHWWGPMVVNIGQGHNTWLKSMLTMKVTIWHSQLSLLRRSTLEWKLLTDRRMNRQMDGQKFEHLCQTLLEM